MTVVRTKSVLELETLNSQVSNVDYLKQKDTEYNMLHSPN